MGPRALRYENELGRLPTTLAAIDTRDALVLYARGYLNAFGVTMQIRPDVDASELLSTLTTFQHRLNDLFSSLGAKETGPIGVRG